MFKRNFDNDKDFEQQQNDRDYAEWAMRVNRDHETGEYRYAQDPQVLSDEDRDTFFKHTDPDQDLTNVIGGDDEHDWRSANNNSHFYTTEENAKIRRNTFSFDDYTLPKSDVTRDEQDVVINAQNNHHIDWYRELDRVNKLMPNKTKIDRETVFEVEFMSDEQLDLAILKHERPDDLNALFVMLFVLFVTISTSVLGDAGFLSHPQLLHNHAILLFELVVTFLYVFIVFNQLRKIKTRKTTLQWVKDVRYRFLLGDLLDAGSVAANIDREDRFMNIEEHIDEIDEKINESKSTIKGQLDQVIKSIGKIGKLDRDEQVDDSNKEDSSVDDNDANDEEDDQIVQLFKHGRVLRSELWKYTGTELELYVVDLDGVPFLYTTQYDNSIKKLDGDSEVYILKTDLENFFKFRDFAKIAIVYIE